MGKSNKITELFVLTLQLIIFTSVFLYTTSFIHEMGHFAIMKLYNVPVKEIVICEGFTKIQTSIAGTPLILGLNPFNGSYVKIMAEGYFGLIYTINGKYLALSVSGPFVVIIINIIILYLLRLHKPNSLKTHEYWEPKNHWVKNKSLNVIYTSIVIISGFCLVLPGLFIWNNLINKKQTYKLFLFKETENQKDYIGWILYFIKISLLMTIISVYPYGTNDFWKLPIMTISAIYYKGLADINPFILISYVIACYTIFPILLIIAYRKYVKTL